MRFVWLTARDATISQANEEGMGETTRDQLLEFTSPNVSVTQDGTKDFTFDKEFFMLFNKEMDPALIAQIDEALTEIYADGEIAERQKASFFIPDFKPSEEAQAYLRDKRDAYEGIISSLKK